MSDAKSVIRQWFDNAVRYDDPEERAVLEEALLMVGANRVMKAASLQGSLSDSHEERIDRLEKQKLGATPEEIVSLQKRIDRAVKYHDLSMDNLALVGKVNKPKWV